MKPRTVAAIGGVFVLVAIAFFLLGRAMRPAADRSRQYINLSKDPREFRNEYLGLTVRVAPAGDWRLAWHPSQFRFPLPANANKVLEIERILPADGSDTQWARMDLFVEPLLTSTAARHMLRKLEFRDKREGFRVVSEQDMYIGGRPGHVRIGAWAVKNRKYRSANYYVEVGDKLFAFIAVAEADAFERFEPSFREIVATVSFR